MFRAHRTLQNWLLETRPLSWDARDDVVIHDSEVEVTRNAGKFLAPPQGVKGSVLQPVIDQAAKQVRQRIWPLSLNSAEANAEPIFYNMIDLGFSYPESFKVTAIPPSVEDFLYQAFYARPSMGTPPNNVLVLFEGWGWTAILDRYDDPYESFSLLGLPNPVMAAHVAFGFVYAWLDELEAEHTYEVAGDILSHARVELGKHIEDFVMRVSCGMIVE